METKTKQDVSSLLEDICNIENDEIKIFYLFALKGSRDPYFNTHLRRECTDWLVLMKSGNEKSLHEIQEEFGVDGMYYKYMLIFRKSLPEAKKLNKEFIENFLKKYLS